MAPAVSLSTAYNFTADSYSFGTVLWEMISLEKPYDGFSRKRHADQVVRGGMQPDVLRSWTVPLRIVIKRSWSQKITEKAEHHECLLRPERYDHQVEEGRRRGIGARQEEVDARP